MNANPLYNLFESLLANSKTFQGRFIVLEGYGNDLNADNNNENHIEDAINSRKWSRKYPCVAMMPPRVIGANSKKKTHRVQVQVYFITTTYHTGSGSIKNVNIQTNTSKVSIKEDWEQMSSACSDFISVLKNKFYSDLSVLQTVRPVRNANQTIQRFSLKNNDRLSGVLLTTEFDLVDDCIISDYVNNNVTISDYATFNSDSFLTDLCNLGGAYGYKCINAAYNGNDITVDPAIALFTTVDVDRIPFQTGDRITIPNHNEDFLSYDKNWISFLNSLSISSFLTFRTSPFNHINALITDDGYPKDIIEHSLSDITESPYYGEGFQIEWETGSTFRFTIEYYYQLGHGPLTKQHTIIFTESGYNIDGADVHNSNMRDINEYVI